MDGLDLSALCQFPGQLPPDGQTSNFVDPKTLQPDTIAVGVIMTALAAFFTGVRLYANFRKLDLADLMGTVLVATYTILVLAFSQYARHMWDMPACWFNASYLKFLFAEMTIFGPAVFFPKAAIFLMYRQYFHMYEPMRYAIYFGLFVTAITYWASIFIAAYYGAPRPGQPWEDLLFNGMPEHESTYGVIQGSVAIIMDVYTFVLPLPILLKLRLSAKKRLQLIALFSTALIAVVASIVAIVFRAQLRSREDTTWRQACASIAVIIESNVAIIVGAMPAFAGFLRTNIYESSLYRSLRTKFFRVSGSSSSRFGSTEASGSKQHVATIGSPGRDPGHRPYDPSDTANLESVIAVRGDEHTETQREPEMAQNVLYIQEAKPPLNSSSV